MTSTGPLPRERIAQVGVANATDTELLAALLGSGTRQQSVFDLATRIIETYPLAKLSQVTLNQFLQITGLGQTQATRLLACTELGKRIHASPLLPTIFTSSDVVKQVGDLRVKKREYLVVLYLNARQELLQQETVSIGGLNYTNVLPRDVFSLAVSLPAAYVVLVHNHPSGSTEPSQADLQVTERLCAAGQLLGIEVIDHLIMAFDGYFSFREAGMM